MKKNLLIFAAAFAAFSAFGKGATQEWVRRQLSALARPSSSTNFTITAAVPTSWFDDETGGTASGTICAEIGTHPALKVVASTVAEIPVGTFYARDSHGVYQNAKNALLPSITAVPYTTSRTTTNALGVASVASVTMGNFWATDTTGAAWYMGIDGDTLLYCATDRSRYIAIRSTTLPERAASALMPTATAGLSVRAMLALAFPSAYARTDSETVYTVKAETTISIGSLTFTRKNRFGKETTVTFTPKDLQGVYKGPNGPFETKEEARDALKNLDNWDFGDWDTVWNAENMSRMSREEFERSDVWRQLLEAYESEKVEELVETPGMPAHPCPAPDDFWVFDLTVWNDMTLTEADAAELAWKVNEKYRAADSAYDADPEKLDKWRGENNCTCAVVGCGKNGTAQHRVGRVRAVNGELVTTDGDEGDGCKCCVRCVKYGSDPFVTINEYNSHRANGEGAGFCGCACGKYTTENEKDWPQDFHNRPKRVGGVDFACLCYCGKDKAAAGEYVQHMKYAGDSPWCHKICSACELVEDEEQYIKHNWPAFDTRHVTLREPTWEDHTPRSEADDGANTVADPTYYQRCGCACGMYDSAKTSGLPAEFASFHQPTADSCRCQCGQTHTKNRIGDTAVDPFPCSEICAVCKKVEDKDSDAVFTFNGETYKKVVMIEPTDEKYHTAHDALCGCKCYNGVTTRHTWSKGGEPSQSVNADGGKLPKFHVVNASGCGCECDGVIRSELSGAYHPGPHETLGPCWCKCGERHIGYSQKTKCRVCANCGKTESGDIPADESLHVLKDGATGETGQNICRCECGYYSSEGAFTTVDGGSNTVWEAVARQPSASGVLHDFDTSDGAKNAIGSLPCECFCGGKHEARMATTYQKNLHGDRICPNICTYCRKRLKDGTTAAELDHEPRPASDKYCGCKCRYYGIDEEHEAAGRAAQSAHLHIQSKGNAEGVAYCQCFGAGTGGKHHWHYKRAACEKICEYVRTLDKLGHLATESGHEIGFKAATGEDHTPKAHGCGCACGLCGEETKTLWADVKTLHKPAQNATDRCHCECEKKHLVGSGEGGHEWPALAAVNACTCTCGEHHKDDWVNACGFCSVCGHIWRNGQKLDATIAGNHLFTYGGCYCDGACVVGGSKILHPQGHIYPSKSCTCQCRETTLDHIVTTEKQKVGTWTCWKCYARFINYYITTKCARCGLTLEPGKGVSLGKHKDDCGEPHPGCWNCGCSCSGSHTRCNGHYCSTCCNKKPTPPPRPGPNPDPDDPDPDPPDPYESCEHVFATENWDGTDTCGECGATFTFSGHCEYCTKCGWIKETVNNREGQHGPPCTDDDDDPTHECNPSMCGAALSGGGTCSEMYCSECESCPNATGHANYHGGNGGSGGGNLDDI